jgi:hypothetical protein
MMEDLRVRNLSESSVNLNPSVSPGYLMRIIPGVTGGYAIQFDGDMFVAASIEELPNVIIAAVARKKIKT